MGSFVTESGGPAKSRWTAIEVSTLVEAWAEVHNAPGVSRIQRGRGLDRAIFAQYSARCVQSGLRRRSPSALSSQRDRIRRFARFIRDFDRQEAALGRRSWFQLSREEQQRAQVPAELRRQLSTFSSELFQALIRLVPNDEGVRSNGLKSKGESPTIKQRRPCAGARQRPCWTAKEEVRLVHRWGRYAKGEGLTLQAFVANPCGRSFEHFAPANRSSVASWRKIRSLVASHGFISAFNRQHQSGWFDLSDAERDVRTDWTALPPNFAAIQHDVFNALEEIDLEFRGHAAAAPSAGRVKEERTPLATVTEPPPPPRIPTPPPSTELQATQLRAIVNPFDTESVKLETLLSADSPANALDQIMLEDDTVAEGDDMWHPSGVPAPASLNDGDFLSDACALLDGKVLDGFDALNVDEKSVTCPQQPIDVKPSNLSDDVVHTLELALGQQKSELQRGLHQLQATFDHEAMRDQESLRAMTKSGQGIGKPDEDFSRRVSLLVTKRNQQLMDMLRLAEDVRGESGAEVRALMLQLMGVGDAELLRDGCSKQQRSSTVSGLGCVVGRKP
ncbi:hypothetical protein BBJ28_00006042 [Nothophytophthora sp. Chile5]|nr:hypothetical protein BBJ28_00006042 [Nothophytophthora sp. Chile5]